MEETEHEKVNKLVQSVIVLAALVKCLDLHDLTSGYLFMNELTWPAVASWLPSEV